MVPKPRKRHWPRTLYDVLGVKQGETNRHELDRAKRFCLRFVHPDKSRMDQDAATDKRTLVETAYEILTDENKSRVYQRMLSSAKGAIAVKNVRRRGLGHEGAGGKRGQCAAAGESAEMAHFYFYTDSEKNKIIKQTKLFF